MLTVKFLQQPQDRKMLLEQFDGNSATWIVSDLKQKFEIQQKILKTQSFFEDHSVLRASEFWKILARRKFPALQWVTPEWVKTWVKNEISKDKDLKLNNCSYRTVVEFMNLFSPLHFHQLGGQRMREWFKENPASLQRWGGWYLLSEKFSQDLLAKSQASIYWTQSLLQNETVWENFWDRKIIIDLGIQISTLESELIKSLSKHLDIEVLIPQPHFKAEFKYLFRPYEDLIAYTDTRSTPTERSEAVGKIHSVKHSGVLAEVKSAVNVIRNWLENGVIPENIIIAAADMEQYWPLLEPLLRIEGIPVNKAVVSRLQTQPAASNWLAELRIKSGLVSFKDLETASFSKNILNIRFEEFFSLFSALMDQADLKRHPEIEKAFKAKFSPDDLLSQDEFLGFSVGCWNDFQFESLEICLRELMAVSSKKDKLRLSDWIFFIEQVVAKKEVNVLAGVPTGINISNIPAAEALNQTHKLYLGLCESMLRSKNQKLVSGQEISSIAKDLGYFLEDPDISISDFDLKWQFLSQPQEVYYFCPATGFKGEAEAPSAFWLAQDAKYSKQTISLTHWDVLLNQAQAAAKSEDPRISVTVKKELRFSPSAIESFRECPYIFLAQRIFRLQDNPILDLDVDRRSRGNLVHKLLEKIILGELKSITLQEVSDILSAQREAVGLSHLDEFVWKSLCEKYFTLAKKFILIEKEEKFKYPKQRNLAVEKEFKVLWNHKDKKFSKQDDLKGDKGDGFLLSGRIDRIDQNEDFLAIYDYKMSPGDYGHFTKWLKENQLQLAIYMLAIEDEAVEGINDNKNGNTNSKKVAAATYYILKNFKKDKGLCLEEADGSFYQLDKKKNRISQAGKEELKQAVRDLLSIIFDAVKAGEYTPKPLNSDGCNDCIWREQCRAPHLI